MDYEVFAPDPDEEFYEELCENAWTKMFNGDYDFEDASFAADLYCNFDYD